jgi:integrase
MRTANKLVITDAWLKAVAPPEPRKTEDGDKPTATLYWDRDSPLVVKVTSGGAKSFCCTYRTKSGIQRWYHVGSYPNVRIAAAREKARDVRDAAAKGGDPHKTEKIDARRRQRELLSFEHLVKKYTAAHQGMDALPQYLGRLKKEVLPSWGTHKAIDITQDDVHTLISNIGARAPGSARLTRAAVSAVFQWGIDTRLVRVANPCRGFSIPAAEKDPDHDRTRVYSHRELRAMWEVFNEIEAGDVLKVLLLTGQRREEVAEMTWEEIEGQWWTIPGSRAKNNVPHSVWLADAALALLGERAEGRVFAKGTKWCLDRGWATVEDRTGIEQHEEGAQIRDLRRTFQTSVAEHIDEPWLADLLTNHVKRGMRKIYDKAKHRGRMRAAWDAWATMLTEKIVQGQPVEDRKVIKFGRS